MTKNYLITSGDVECPFCRAQPGQACEVDGVKIDGWHMRRRVRFQNEKVREALL